MGTTTSTIPSDFSASFIQDLADSLGIPTTAVYIKAITVVSSQGTEMVVAVEYGIVTLGGKSGDEEVLEAMQDLVYPPTTTTVTLTVPTDGQANTRRLPRPVLMCQGGSTTPNGAFVQACQGYRDRFHAIARMPVGR